MKVLKKNVYTAKICVCTKHCTEVIGVFGDSTIGHTTIEDDVMNSEELFIKVGIDDYRQARDLYNASKGILPLSKSAILNKPMTNFETRPNGVGDFFLKDLKPVYHFVNDEKIDLADVLIDYYKGKSEEKTTSIWHNLNLFIF